MIGNLIKEAPHMWTVIKDLLKLYVNEAEKRYGAPKGSYHYRFMRPDDSMISGGTQYTYYATMSTAAAEDILATAAVLTVQTREAIMSCGWYLDTDLDMGGYLLVQKEGVTKSELPARFVWRQKKPDHFYLDLDTIVYAEENARLRYITYNAFGADRVAISLPILFRIAPRAALNLERSLVA
jgi:hypothetical protein